MSTARISQKVARIAESATLAIDAKAKALKAAGIDIIGFGAGEPDFPTPEFIVEAAVVAARDPRNHRYTPATGLPELREAIAAKTRRDSKIDVDASQVIVTSGGKHAVFNTIMTLVDDGDEVLIPSPFWTTYPELVRLAGGTPIEVKTTFANEFKTSPAELEPYLTERTKLFIHVSPSNPTGTVYTEEETASLANFLDAAGIWVMSDDIYEHLTYDGMTTTSLLSKAPNLRDRTVLVNGVAKTYAMTGWRVGWMVGPSDVIKAAGNLQSQATSNIANVSQRAALAALTADLSTAYAMREAFDRRRRTIHAMLSEIPGFATILPKGAFYVFPDVSELIGRRIRGHVATSSTALAEILLEQAKVAVVPGEAFGTPGYFRLSYALSDDALVEGVDRIAKLIAEVE